MLRRLLPIAVFLCYIGIFATGAAGAAALPMDRCTTTSGVVVAVDFGHWGGPIVRACGSTPTTGAQQLNQGGFSTVSVARFQYFICRIGYSGFHGGTQYPTPAEFNCVNTPPLDKSWSYWNGDYEHNTWTLTAQGAYDYSPAPGSVQAWTYGGGAPSFSPDSVRAHNRTPAGGGPSSSGGAPAGSPAPVTSGTSGIEATAAAPVGSRPSGASRPAARVRSSSTPRRTAAATSAGASSPVAPTGSATSARIVNAQPVAAARPKASGSWVPALGGAALVLALLGLAGFTVRQRRRAG